jgi:hypothetical protein
VTQTFDPEEPDEQPVIEEIDEETAEAGTIIQQPAPRQPAPDLLPQTQTDTSTPWFGYIGIGIALVAMVLGLVGVVAGVVLFISWTQK